MGRPSAKQFHLTIERRSEGMIDIILTTYAGTQLSGTSRRPEAHSAKSFGGVMLVFSLDVPPGTAWAWLNLVNGHDEIHAVACPRAFEGPHSDAAQMRLLGQGQGYRPSNRDRHSAILIDKRQRQHLFPGGFCH